MADEGLESLGQRGIGNVALVLVELAGREQAARRDEHLVQFVRNRGLANAGIAGHEHELGRTLGHDALEGREQGVDLALPPVQPLRDHEAVRGVVHAGRERVDPSGRLPCCLAPAKVSLDPSGGLIALLGGLREKLHHDRRELGWYRNHPFAGRDRLSRDVAVNPFHRIGGGEG